MNCTKSSQWCSKGDIIIVATHMTSGDSEKCGGFPSLRQNLVVSPDGNFATPIPVEVGSSSSLVSTDNFDLCHRSATCCLRGQSEKTEVGFTLF